MTFYTEAFKVLIQSLRNNYSDNWDYIRFGKEPAMTQTKSIKLFIKARLNQLGIIRSTDLLQLTSKIEKEGTYFSYLYDHLENQQSKELLVQVFAFRLLGHKKVKLPLNNQAYWQNIARVDELFDKTDSIDSHFSGFKLFRFDLNKLGYPIHLYFAPLGIVIDFVVKQYEYHYLNYSIKAEEGDVVIDGGGCWGDTALFFANAVGGRGKVFSFEFIQSNVTLWHKNISLNPNLKSNITIVPHPLWENSGSSLYMKDKGPASRVSMDSFPDQTGRVDTISIDDFADQQQLTRLDFIKLDIEGAELMALKGAARSIKRFKPKLAVALYHNSLDFQTIPQYLDSLELGYKFYLSHCTIQSEETVLFATAR